MGRFTAKDGVTRHRRSLFLSTSLTSTCLVMLVALAPRPAWAQPPIDGGAVVTVPGDEPSPWNIPDDLVVAQTGTAQLNIINGGTVTNNNGYIGASAGSSGSVLVSGTDGFGHASTWTSDPSDMLFVGADGTGSLSIEAGGVVNSGIGDIGDSATGSGTVTVTGNGSTWNTGIHQIDIGNSGTGSLTITDGGTVNSNQGNIGFSSGSTGTVTVSGNGSTWEALDNIYIGEGGSGALTIADGAAVSTAGTGVGGAATVYIGYGIGSTGVLTISSSNGIASTLTMTDALQVGLGGTGTATIDNGGLVSVGSGVTIAGDATATGTLHLLGNVSGRGILETADVTKGAGDATLDLDGGILRATQDTTDFLPGFTALTVGSEGAWFDTNGHDIAVGTAFSGSSTLNKLGLGTLTLTGDSSGLTGTTTISAGTLQLGDGHASGMIGGDVVDNGTLAFDRADTITFGNLIGGTGGVSQIGSGTTVLTNTNSYAGGTEIDNGTLQVSTDGNLGDAAGGITFDGGTLKTTADITNSRPIAFMDAGTVATDAGTTLTLDGILSGTGTFTKAGAGTVVLTGDSGGYAGATTIDAGTLQLGNGGTSGSIAGDIADNGTLAFDRSDTVTVAGSIGGTGALNQIGSGTVVLTGDNSLYTGAATVEAGTLAVNGVMGGSIAVNAAGRLEGTGRIGTTTNSGIITPGFGGAMGTLTVQGDYTGNGGHLEIATALGDDSSPTSRLVVDGATSGTTQVDVTNRGGLGGRTAQGIEIVNVTGASNGKFVLDGDYVFHGSPAVIAGAYGYRLYQGVGGSTDGNWYLRSSLLDPGDPGDPGEVSDPGEASDPGPQPLYQPGVPVYEAYGANLLALNTLPTLQQRVGNRRWAAGSNPEGTGIWGRIEGVYSHADGAHTTTGSNQDIDIWKMQFGADRVVYAGAGGERLVAGITATYGKANSTIRSGFGNGAIDTAGYGIGATLTWYGLNGFYVDGQAQVSHYDSDLNSDVLGRLTHDNGGFGEALSLEIGKRVPVGGKFSLTPQAQVIYSNVSFDRFVDPAGAIVAADRDDSLKTRLGISLDRQSAWASGRSHLYGLVNLSYEGLNGTRALVSGTPIEDGNERLWGELGMGASVSWRNGVTLYGEISGGSPFSGFGDSYAVEGDAGIRLQF